MELPLFHYILNLITILNQFLFHRCVHEKRHRHKEIPNFFLQFLWMYLINKHFFSLFCENVCGVWRKWNDLMWLWNIHKLLISFFFSFSCLVELRISFAHSKKKKKRWFKIQFKLVCKDENGGFTYKCNVIFSYHLTITIFNGVTRNF